MIQKKKKKKQSKYHNGENRRRELEKSPCPHSDVASETGRREGLVDPTLLLSQSELMKKIRKMGMGGIWCQELRNNGLRKLDKTSLPTITSERNEDFSSNLHIKIQFNYSQVS